MPIPIHRYILKPIIIMKKFLSLVAIATTTLLWANVVYANLSDSNDFNNQASYNYDEDANSSSCASSCSAVNAGSDCGNAIYEIDEFPGSSHHSTSVGNGSGLGCKYHGFSSPYTLGAGTGSSYTLCTEYTASSVEASYVVYLNAANSSCINRSLSVFKANTCSVPSGLNLEQPVGSFPGRARGLTVGESYVVCHKYTESGCSSDFSSNIFEVCMTISEASYCNSHVAPSAVEVCSGEDFQIPLGGNCTVDPDLGVPFGTPGYAAFFYSQDGGNTFTNFPANSIIEDVAVSSNYKFFDESNFSNGAGCSPIDMRAIVNTGCEPLVIPVGIGSIDVSSVGSSALQVLYDCPIVETTITVYPQLTSQVTGSSIQLIAEDGTVCETYSTTSSPISVLPTGFTPDVLISSVLSSGIHNVPASNVILGGVGDRTRTVTIGSGGGIPDDIPCVTPQGLAAVSDNGETLIAHTVEVNEEGQLVFTYELPTQNAKLYPNPASSQLFFSAGINDTYTVRIYDTLGKQVFAGQTNDDTAIDIQHLSSGLYTYILEDNQQNIFDHGKWVKQ